MQFIRTQMAHSRNGWVSLWFVVALAVLFVLPGQGLAIESPTSLASAISHEKQSTGVERLSSDTVSSPKTTGPGYVKWTLCPWNNTLLNGSGGTCLNGVGESPEGAAFDSTNGDIYVANDGSGTVSVISGATNRIIDTISPEMYPAGAAFDSTNGNIYFTNSNSNNVSVVSGATNTVIATIPVGANPNELAFDSTNGDLYVPNINSNNVSVVSGATNAVIATIPVGAAPYHAAFDITNGDIYVTNHNSNNVSVISGATNRIIATVPVGSEPVGAAFDSTNGDIYVADTNSSNVSVVSGATNTVIATILTGATPYEAAFDSTNGNIYVANFNVANMSVISGATNTVISTISVGSSPWGEAFDPTNGDLYVTNFMSTNVSVISGATNTVIATIPSGQTPIGAAFDSTNGDLYVANQLSNNMSVVSGVMNRVIATIPLGKSPTGVAFDSTSGDLYVANQLSNNMSVVSGATNTVIATIPVGVAPTGAAFDSTNGDIYVANTFSFDVSVVSGATNTVIATIPSGQTPIGVAFDSTNGDIYVANSNSNNVSVISGATNRVIANIPVGAYPQGVAFDPTNGNLYVPYGRDVVSVISGATNTVTATILVGIGPVGAAFDSTNGDIYVANSFSNSESVVSGATNTVIATLPVGVGPVRAAFDSTNGDVYVTNYDSGSVSIIVPGLPPLAYNISFTESGLPGGTSWNVVLNGVSNSSTTNTMTFTVPNGTYSFIVGTVAGYVASPSSGLVGVNGTNMTRLITFTNSSTKSTYTVTFQESGLLNGQNWSVSLNGTSHFSNTPSILFNEPNGTYNYTIASLPGFTVTGGYTHTFAVSGAPVSVTVNFTRVDYAIYFTESGLPTGTLWNVSVGGINHGTTTSSLSISVPNGTYSYNVLPPTNYVASPPYGNVAVNGSSPPLIAIQFTQSTSGYYAVNFNENTLPSGLTWSVSFGGVTKSASTSTGNPIQFSEPNGTYNYSASGPSGYVAIPSSGGVMVIGAATSVTINFQLISPGEYPVEFEEGGLRSGTTWSMNLNGTVQTSGGTSITYLEGNGTYAYAIDAKTGYTLNTSSGTVHVVGGSVTVWIHFAANATYTSAPFYESGLAAGTKWSIEIDGTFSNSTTNEITFLLTTGPHQFQVLPVSGYDASPSSGWVNITTGPTASERITFTATSPHSQTNGTSTFLGLPGYDGYILIGTIAAIVVIAMAVLLMRRRKRATPKASPPQAPPPAPVGTPPAPTVPSQQPPLPPA